MNDGRTNETPGRYAHTIQRLRARVARRPGRWRRRMARSRLSDSPSVGWETKSRDDRLHTDLELCSEVA